MVHTQCTGQQHPSALRLVCCCLYKDSGTYDSSDDSDGSVLEPQSKRKRNDDAHDTSESDTEDAEPLPAQLQSGKFKQIAETRAIYVRIPAATNKDTRRNLTRMLRNKYVGAMIFLDDSQSKTPCQDRDALALLWQHIEDRRIECLLIPRMNHICKSKEAFQLFEWICNIHDARIRILPALELVIKSARTLAQLRYRPAPRSRSTKRPT